jgi:hypothetical protein
MTATTGEILPWRKTLLFLNSPARTVSYWREIALPAHSFVRSPRVVSDVGDPTGKQEKDSAEKQLAVVKAQWSTINQITGTLRMARQENNFAHRLRLAFRQEEQ